MMRDYPHMANSQAFEYVIRTGWCHESEKSTCSVKIKDVKLSYHVEKVFSDDIPALQHGNDGLIYTCATTPYVPATDINMWATLWRLLTRLHTYRGM